MAQTKREKAIHANRHPKTHEGLIHKKKYIENWKSGKNWNSWREIREPTTDSIAVENLIKKSGSSKTMNNLLSNSHTKMVYSDYSWKELPSPVKTNIVNYFKKKHGMKTNG